MTSLRVTDMLGNEYGVGDHVVYGTISGKSPVLKYAVVEKIKPEERTRLVRSGEFEEFTRPDGTSFQRERWKEETYTYVKVGVRELKNGRGFIRWDTRDYKDGAFVEKPARVTWPMTENIVKAIGPTEAP